MFVTAVIAPMLYVLVGQAMPVPMELQGVLFSKILKYDRTISAQVSSLKVLVLHDGPPDGMAEQVRKTFSELGYSVDTVDTGKLSRIKSDGPLVIYVRATTFSPEVASFCEQRKALSITGWPALVEKGLISIGLDRRSDGRPEIVVNRARLKKEGHDLSSQLLSLARVVE